MIAPANQPSIASSILDDPVEFIRVGWPDVRIYDKQAEILYSLRDNDETIVPAGNQLGKDFITGLAVLWFFLSRSPCRIVTSSSGQKQLESVLWGEMARFIMTCKFKLPIDVKHQLIRYILPSGEVEPRSYIRGIVTNDAENLQDHHLERTGGIPRTLAVFDEASSIEDPFYDASDTWAHRKLIIGNPLPCSNFFFRHVEQGDVRADDDSRYLRRVIRIRAQDSPSVRLAERLLKAGKKPCGTMVLPGVVDWDTYQKRRKLWDPIRQCIGLEGQFYKGAEVLLYPPDWLNYAEEFAASITSRTKRRCLGVDSAEGNDETVWTICDSLGFLYQEAMRTSDTSNIPGHTIELMREWNIDSSDVLFDRGGGGKQHADIMRKMGYKVRTVGFGEAPTDVTEATRKAEVRDKEEVRRIYRNRRAEMYGLLRRLLNLKLPDFKGFGLPAEYHELRRQLSLIPLQYDAEGVMFLPPKDKVNKDSDEVTLKQIIGRSPDQADSAVLAVFGLLNPAKKTIVGAAA